MYSIVVLTILVMGRFSVKSISNLFAYPFQDSGIKLKNTIQARIRVISYEV